MMAGGTTPRLDPPPPPPATEPTHRGAFTLPKGLGGDDEDEDADDTGDNSWWSIRRIVTIGVPVGVVVLVAIILIALNGPGTTSATSETSTTTAVAATPATSVPATQISTTTTSAAPVASSGSTHVILALSLGFTTPDGKVPLMFTIEGTTDAPGTQTVKVTFTGPGLPASDTFVVATGKSVTHNYTVSCGSWKGKVVSVNGSAINAGSDPNLQNGATHAC